MNSRRWRLVSRFCYSWTSGFMRIVCISFSVSVLHGSSLFTGLRKMCFAAAYLYHSSKLYTPSHCQTLYVSYPIPSAHTRTQSCCSLRGFSTPITGNDWNTSVELMSWVKLSRIWLWGMWRRLWLCWWFWAMIIWWKYVFSDLNYLIGAELLSNEGTDPDEYLDGGGFLLFFLLHLKIEVNSVCIIMVKIKRLFSCS